MNTVVISMLAIHDSFSFNTTGILSAGITGISGLGICRNSAFKNSGSIIFLSFSILLWGGIRHRTNQAFYKMLLEKKLITKEKYRRLTEVNVDATVLDGFVNRQLVSTNQSVKGVIQLLKKYKNVKNSDIIFSKAENISDFRNEYDMLKSRTANNFHHAHDAYLNVVIGRAINTYYEKNRILGINDVYKIQDEAKTLNPLKILKCRKIYDLSGKLVWDLKENISKIEKYF